MYHILSRYNADFVMQRIEHAGHKRYIIHRNPRRYDEDGNRLDEDEVDEQADADAAARNPYGDIRLRGNGGCLDKSGGVQR